MFRKRDIFPKDIGERRIPVLALERRRTVQHLIYQDAQRPPIDRTGVAASLNHLGRDILLRANERVGPEVCRTRLGIDHWHLYSSPTGAQHRAYRASGTQE